MARQGISDLFSDAQTAGVKQLATALLAETCICLSCVCFSPRRSLRVCVCVPVGVPCVCRCIDRSHAQSREPAERRHAARSQLLTRQRRRRRRRRCALRNRLGRFNLFLGGFPSLPHPNPDRVDSFQVDSQLASRIRVWCTTKSR